MNIKLHEISVRDLVSGYADSGGVGGRQCGHEAFHGRLSLS